MTTVIKQLENVLDQGFRMASVRWGMRRTIDAGRPAGSHRRPTEDEFERVVAAAEASNCSFLGHRNRAILRLMARSGARSMSMTAMDGRDFERRRGRLFLWIKEKGRLGKRQIEVPPDVVPLLDRYVEAFNLWATEQGWSCRIGIGEPGAFWRAGGGKAVTYPGLLAMARTARSVAGVTDFHLHGLRHMRAGYLGQYLNIHDAALAGGWHGPAVYEKHYARALRRFGPENPQASPPDEEVDYWPGSDGGRSHVSATPDPTRAQS